MKKSDEKLGEALREAINDPTYIMLFLGFFSCGFQLAFITAHFPAFIAESSSPIIQGSIISFVCNSYTHLKLFRSCRMLQFEVNVIKKDAIILYDFVSTAFYSCTLYLQGSHSCLPRFILVFEFRNSQKIVMFLSEILQISKISLNFMKFPRRFVDVEISEH